MIISIQVKLPKSVSRAQVDEIATAMTVQLEDIGVPYECAVEIVKQYAIVSGDVYSSDESDIESRS